MKVTIKREEREKKIKTGVFSSKKIPEYIVTAEIQFSETELAIIKKRNLGDALVYKKQIELMGDPHEYDYTIDVLIKQNTLWEAFETPVEANEFENELKTGLLPNLKQYIEDNAESAPKTESFEL